MGLRDTKNNLSTESASFRVPFIFFGNETLATGVESNGVVLKSLLDIGWQPDALVLAQRKPSKKPHTVEQIANTHNIPIEYVGSKAELPDIVERYNPSFAVLAAFGMIITQEVLDMIPDGIVNIHPSLLPKYRGSSPIEAAILQGDTHTGVSLMRLDAGMDTGELYEQRELEANPQDVTKQELHDLLAELGSQMLVDHIDSIASGTAQTSTQLKDNVSTTDRISKSDGEISWDQPAEVIERKVRAYAGWPKTKAVLDGTEVILHDVAVTDFKAETPGDIEIGDNALFVSAQDKQLEIFAIQPDGKQTMDTQAFVNGYLAK